MDEITLTAIIIIASCAIGLIGFGVVLWSLSIVDFMEVLDDERTSRNAKDS